MRLDSYLLLGVKGLPCEWSLVAVVVALIPVVVATVAVKAATMRVDRGEGPTIFVLVSYVGVGLVKLQSYPLALDHPPSESCRLFAVVLHWFFGMLGFGSVYTNKADPLLVLQNEGVTVDHSSNGTDLWLAFSQLRARMRLDSQVLLESNVLPTNGPL